ncbi:MAG: ABC transporter ATP-binding protein [Planctomycetaceae bacterium]|jgi:ABC-2 type transport system ATP-binding protein
MSLAVSNLAHAYARVTALRDVSFEVPPGELVALIGPNGAGKSTLLKILATFVSPTHGTARVAGCDVRTQAREVRQQLGYLPEQLPSDPVLRVREYLDLRARLKQLDRSRRSVEIDRVLGLCELAPVRDRLLDQLSTGYRRRVGLADALLGSPPVLLLDEPTVGLDPMQVRQTRELIRSLAGTSTVLLSTHLLNEAEQTCSRALVLWQGGLISDVQLPSLAAGAELELELDLPATQLGTQLRDLPGVARVALLESSSPPPDPQPTVSRWRVTLTPAGSSSGLAAACVGRGWGVRELRRCATTLEEHLLQVLPQSLRETA